MFDASDVGHVRRHLGATAQKITLLLIDVSGSRDPGFVLTLAHKYARCFPSIRLILMKSFKVASIVENTCVVPRS